MGLLLGSRNAIIRNCHFEGCGTDEANGTLPRSGIDFEPDGVRSYPEIGNQNVLMENCTFKNNCHDISSARNNLKNMDKPQQLSEIVSFQIQLDWLLLIGYVLRIVIFRPSVM